MSALHAFTSVRFHRYKAFRDYSLTLGRFNILVGPNNSGKSTILSAFRILSEGIRKARSRNPTMVPGPHGRTRGYEIDVDQVSVATENVFFDYDDSEPATVHFRLSNKNDLVLFFPAPGVCSLICEGKGPAIVSTAGFKTHYNVTVGFVPILGPVEHEEQLYQKEAARLALLTHRAARNFRNIWHHYPDDFDEFRALLRETWPGMDVDRPEIDHTLKTPLLKMFCPEERIPREIFWAGFGFQVWCQMLTYVVRNRNASLFMIDEPDIYLHSDLQRQLLAILKNLGPDILIATHSTEIISEADPDDILVVNKGSRAARRVKEPTQLQQVFGVLGSNLNPVLTQLAKTRRALFVEGKDFQVIARFARKLGNPRVANRSDFAVVPVEGFNPVKVAAFVQAIGMTLGSPVSAAVVFDRDYRSEAECEKEAEALGKSCVLVRIHRRKELENFLLLPQALQKAAQRRIAEREARTGEKIEFPEDMSQLLDTITDGLRHRVAAQFLSRRRPFEKALNPGLDGTTIDEELMAEFESAWRNLDTRLLMVPGKEVLGALNDTLQRRYRITVSPGLIVECCTREEVPAEMAGLIEVLSAFAESREGAQGNLGLGAREV